LIDDVMYLQRTRCATGGGAAPTVAGVDAIGGAARDALRVVPFLGELLEHSDETQPVG
jgi:hypothetical protein